jgi:hypothetical protein
METKKFICILILVVLLVAPASTGWAAFAQRTNQDLGDLERFKIALAQDGFVVTPGEVTNYNIAKAWCDNIPGVDSGLYTNNEPYLILNVPESVEKPKPAQVFQVRPDEAIVLIGLTPPPEKYFAFYPFLDTKVYPDGKKLPSGITLGDAVNNLTIKTAGPTPFNSPVALIFTPDKRTDARVRLALHRAGYPEVMINTVVFPATMLKLGHGENFDKLRIQMRNAFWENQTDGETYITNPPLHLYRLTPGVPADPNPFPAPRQRVRGTGLSEMDLMHKLEALRAGILAANSGLYASELLPVPALGTEYDGYDYLQRRINVYGEARDAFVLNAGYVPEFTSNDELKLADDEFLMVYGVNHVATSKSTYMSLNVYSGNVGKVVIGSIASDKFPGSASPYLADGDPAQDLMYAYKVSRSCGSEPNCLQLTSEGCPRLSIDSNTMLGLIWRMYLEPATRVGAANHEILWDRVLKFSPRPPQS